jgi:ATP-dependent DNA ligase
VAPIAACAKGLPAWLHEIKADGYRMLVIREDKRVRLLSRNGGD